MFAAAAVCLCLALMARPSPALGARLLWVTVRVTQDRSEVLISGQVWARLRGPNQGQAARDLRDRLTQALVTGLHPQDIIVKAHRQQASLMAGGRLLITVTHQQALRQRSSAAGLARRWAHTLKDLVAGQYAAVAPAEELVVPVGERRALSLGGPGASQVQVEAAPGELVELAGREGSKVWVRGLAAGEGRVEVGLGEARVLVPVRVRYWAAAVPEQVRAVVSATPEAEEWRRFSEYALACAVVGRPTARVRLDFETCVWPAASVLLDAFGPELLALSRQVAVQGRVERSHLPLATHVLVSNYPERVKFSNVLMRDVVEKGNPVRLLWHHVNESPRPLWFGVRVYNLACERTFFSWRDAPAGPARDELYVGHLACREYLRQLHRDCGVLLALPPQRWVEFAALRAPRGGIVSGLGELAVVAGGPLMVEIVAHSDEVPHFAAPVPERLRFQPKLKPFRFEGEIRQTVEYTVGGPWTFVSVGKKPRLNEHGAVLHGNYGVLYRFKLYMKNPTTQRAKVELAVQSGGGAARGVFLVNGHLVETPVLRATNEYSLADWVLPAASDKTARVLTVPQSGSNYPVTLILRPKS